MFGLKRRSDQSALRWLGLLVLLFVAGLIGAGLAIGAADRQFHERLDADVAAWQARVDAELPVGASRQQVEVWLERNHLKNALDDGRLYLQLGLREAPWPDFPCASWMIFLDGHFNAAGQLSNRKLHTVGACI